MGPQEKTFASSKPQQAMIRVISCDPYITKTIQSELERILQKHLIKREVDVQEFSALEPMELEAVQAKIRVFGISLEHKKHQQNAGNTVRPEARAQTGSGKDVYVLEGLKEDVLSVTELIGRATQEALFKDFQDKEEAITALNVQWSLKGINGAWQEVSLRDNYMLEYAHTRDKIFVDIDAPDGSRVTVNLKTQEATNGVTGMTYKLKRIESGALEMPVKWDPMQEELFMKVELQPTSQEYREIAQGFLKTAKFNICKIERVQNLYLWNAYSVCKQRIFAKNGQAELGEKTLYHGTTAESCQCIERDRFDRGHAGKHAAKYGKGVYFAVNAAYSANGFSPADKSGLKRMYVVRVLTGRYTVGKSSMISPPPRGSDPTDCYDSLVDNQQQPSMFVIFHDDQAYPEYLITFK
ncbi:poly [ADP-ribose] polymerase 14-like [Astatotilapia calliptera]|uniref:Poly [ADP-ribose] polymerase n=2 Tax=Astatotilapia calliptera TaxID=8154 RepID=A0A3P8PSD9_ASTCA|nr:poly [ADP-ribose] polymerase 14-like [Astatotilapia calliptera]